MATASKLTNELTVVELFQSQSCDSCPPTNANVLELVSDPNLLVLTYGVTYWNHLNWEDTFSQLSFDGRQWDYVHRAKRHNVSTPEVIVNGRCSGISNTRARLAEIINRGRVGNLSVAMAEAVEEGVLLSGKAVGTAFVLMVQYDPRPVEISVTSGENAGKALKFCNVVKKLERIGYWPGGTQAFHVRKADSEDWSVAVLVQDGPGGPVIAACRT